MSDKWGYRRWFWGIFILQTDVTNSNHKQVYLWVFLYVCIHTHLCWCYRSVECGIAEVERLSSLVSTSSGFDLQAVADPEKRFNIWPWMKTAVRDTSQDAEATRGSCWANQPVEKKTWGVGGVRQWCSVWLSECATERENERTAKEIQRRRDQ